MGCQELANAVIKEFVAVANAEDLHVTLEDARGFLNTVMETQQPTKSSMCLNLLQRQLTELDFMNGRIVDLAEAHNIDVPFNNAFTFFVRAIESHFDERAFDKHSRAAALGA